MALPPLLVELKAKANEAVAGFHEFQSEAEKAAKKAEKAGQDAASGLQKSFNTMASVGKAAVLSIGGAAVAIGAEGVKSAMEYQESTAKIAANAGISQHAADQVGNAFLKTMGKSTFSAQQIATAFGPVAGQLKQTEGHALSAGDSMKVMQAAMDAAEASGQDLGTTTDALAGVMQTYHLSVGQAGDASDMLFNASRSLNLPIDQVAMGMEKLKGRLGNLAPSMTDTGALLEELGTHGITGTRGVGVMQTALSTLMGGSKTTKGELDDLGVHLTDAQGNFVGMGSVIDQLSPKLAGMNQAQQTLALTNLFGASSAQVMQQIIAGGASGYQDATAAISKQGSATQAAEKMSHSWQGEIKTAKAALSDLEVVIGQKILPVMSRVIQITTDIIKWFSAHKEAAIALGVVVGGILLAAIGAFTVSLFTAEGALAFLIGPIGLVVIGVAALAAGAVFLATHWSQVWGDIKQWTKDAVDFVKDHLVLIMTVALGPLGLAIAELLKHWKQIWGDIKTAVGDAKDFIVHTVDDVVGFFEKLPGRMASAVAHLWDGITAGFKAAVNWVIGAWDAIPHFHIHIPHVPGTDIGGDLDIGLPHIPLLARGGDIMRAGFAVVGDKGPELLQLGAGARVTPLTGGGGAGGGTMTINIGTVVGTDAGQLARQLAAQIRQVAIEDQRRGVVWAIDRHGRALTAN